MVRTFLAAVLLIALLPAMVVANASTWALQTVVDDDAFTTTVTRSMETPSLREALATEAAVAVVDALERADRRLQTAATLVLGLGLGASAPQLEAALAARILAALDDPRVEAARDEVIRAVHHALLTSARGGGRLVSIQGDQVVLDLSPVVERVVAVVDTRLPSAALAGLAATDAQLVLAEADAFQTASQALTLADALRLIIPLIVVVVILAIVGLAHRRTRALGIVGAAVMVAGLVSLGIAWVGGGVVAGVPEDPTVGRIAADVYDSFTSLLFGQSLLLIVGGALVALLALIALRRRRARRVPPAVSP